MAPFTHRVAVTRFLCSANRGIAHHVHHKGSLSRFLSDTLHRNPDDSFGRFHVISERF